MNHVVSLLAGQSRPDLHCLPPRRRPPVRVFATEMSDCSRSEYPGRLAGTTLWMVIDQGVCTLFQILICLRLKRSQELFCLTN